MTNKELKSLKKKLSKADRKLDARIIKWRSGGKIELNSLEKAYVVWRGWRQKRKMVRL